ncbi:MAG: C39 family peptidase [Candidatus Cyclobacteriaceae bacterium M2_1C_046]
MLKNISLPDFEILTQPDDTTCGPTCLQAVYNYFGDHINLSQVIQETSRWSDGGTLAVILGNNALKRGYKAVLYTYNLMVFDPTWFSETTEKIIELLEKQMEVKHDPKLHFASLAYIKFLKNGGEIRFKELDEELLTDYLDNQMPILTGLSATYLYGTPREIGETNEYDDIKGKPSGHFVVITGYDKEQRQFLVADPLKPNPMARSQQYYMVTYNRLINSIMLGIVTYDANILIIKPKAES